MNEIKVINEETFLFNNEPFYVVTKEIGDDTFTYELPNSVDIDETDIGYSITVKKKDLYVGIAIPSLEFKLIPGNKPYYVNKSFTQKYLYSGSNIPYIHEYLHEEFPDEKNTPNLQFPCIHLVDPSENTSYTVSTSNTEASLTSYKHNYNQYVRILTYAFKDDDYTQFFIDKSSNYLVNLQRFGGLKSDQTSVVNKFTTINVLKRLLFQNGSVANKVDNRKELKVARTIQSKLLNFGISSIFVGSTSLYLNGVDVPINDLDIVIPHFYKEKFDLIKDDLLDDIADVVLWNPDVGEDEYGGMSTIWETNGIKVEVDTTDITRIVTDGYYLRPDRTCETSGLIHSTLQSCLLSSLLIEQNAQRSEFSDEYAISKNQKILSIVKRYQLEDEDPIHRDNDFFNKTLFSDLAGAYFEYVEDYTDNFFEIYDEIKEANRTYLDIRINDPFFVNSYEKDGIHYFTVCNSGSRNPARIITSLDIKSAEWVSLEGDTLLPRFNRENEITTIFIDDIKSVGLLKLEVNYE